MLQVPDSEPRLTRVQSSCSVCDTINVPVQSARQQVVTRTNGGTALTFELPAFGHQ